MKRIAILIATTGGPVLVDRITPEPAPQSMICLRRQSEVLPISPDYDDFVRPGSGIIMREFGPYEEGAFRLDVSGAIGTGLSWQLGVFAAHAVFKSKECELSSLEDADQIVWLTGTVDNDLNVGDVDHMAEKVEASAHLLAEFISKGKPIVFAAGLENAKFLQDHQPPQGIDVAPLKTTQDLLLLLGLAQKPKDKGAKGFFGFAVSALLALGGVYLLTHEQQSEPLSIDVFSDRGQNPTYRFGEDLNLQVRLNKEAWVNCFYEQVDGQVIQVYPNEEVEAVFSFLPSQDHVLSDGEFTPFRIRLGPPAGVETVTCYASKEKALGKPIPAGAASDKMVVTLKP